MAALKRKFARKAVKQTAKHTAHGTASKLRRDPVRAATLFAAGAVAGLLVGWFLARAGSETEPSSAAGQPSPTPLED